MFVKGPSQRTYWIEDVRTGTEAREALATREPLPEEVRLEQNGRVVEESDCLLEHATLHVIVKGGLLGGKGGFGSMLRSIGAQIERTTNHEAMRDLSGRRQRDINNEKRLKDYIASAPERQKEAEEKKEKKLAQLRRVVAGENKSKHEFSDPNYDKARSETEEKVHDAIEAAMAISSTSKAADDKTKDLKRKTDEKSEGVAKKKPKGLWMGDGLEDLDDSDLSDSDDDEADDKKTAVATA